MLWFAADRLSKFWVAHSLRLGQQLFAPSPIRIHVIENSGAAFSLLPDYGWLFVGVAAVVVAGIVWRWRALAREPWWVQVAVGLLLGGACSNALDRIVQGYVLDFIQLPDWPVFNVADMGITVAVVLLVLRSLLGSRQPTSSHRG